MGPRKRELRAGSVGRARATFFVGNAHRAAIQQNARKIERFFFSAENSCRLARPLAVSKSTNDRTKIKMRRASNKQKRYIEHYFSVVVAVCSSPTKILHTNGSRSAITIERWMKTSECAHTDTNMNRNPNKVVYTWRFSCVLFRHRMEHEPNDNNNNISFYISSFFGRSNVYFRFVSVFVDRPKFLHLSELERILQVVSNQSFSRLSQPIDDCLVPRFRHINRAANEQDMHERGREDDDNNSKSWAFVRTRYALSAVSFIVFCDRTRAKDGKTPSALEIMAASNICTIYCIRSCIRFTRIFSVKTLNIYIFFSTLPDVEQNARVKNIPTTKWNITKPNRTDGHHYMNFFVRCRRSNNK